MVARNSILKPYVNIKNFCEFKNGVLKKIEGYGTLPENPELDLDSSSTEMNFINSTFGTHSCEASSGASLFYVTFEHGYTVKYTNGFRGANVFTKALSKEGFELAKLEKERIKLEKENKAEEDRLREVEKIENERKAEELKKTII